MNTPQHILSNLHQNLNILREREAKYGGNAPLDLLNQIEDHIAAIALTEQARAGDLSEAEWREALKPLLLPFWQGLSSSVLAALLAAGPQGQPLQETTFEQLRQSPKGEVLVEGFAEDPDAYEKPIRKELTLRLQDDTDFAARLHRLLADYETAVKQSGPTYQATISGTGSIAQGPGASAATATDGSIAIGGSVGGDVNLDQRDNDDE